MIKNHQQIIFYQKHIQLGKLYLFGGRIKLRYVNDKKYVIVFYVYLGPLDGRNNIIQMDRMERIVLPEKIDIGSFGIVKDYKAGVAVNKYLS